MQVNSMEELKKTKVVVTTHFFNVMNAYGISKAEAIAMITVGSDRGGDVRYGIQDEGITQIFCYGHIINNIVAAMHKVPELKEMISSASELASYLSNSNLSDLLDTTVKNFVPTRWNSVQTMFWSIVQNYHKISEALAAKQGATSNWNGRKAPLEYLKNINVLQMQLIANFLKPFKSMTINMEGHLKPTLHMVWPAYKAIQKQLIETDISAEIDPLDYNPAHDIIEKMKREGRMYVNSRNKDIAPKPLHRIATVLHPLMKSLPKDTSETDKSDAYQLVDRRIRAMEWKDGDQAPVPKTTSAAFDVDFLNEFCENGKKEHINFFIYKN